MNSEFGGNVKGFYNKTNLPNPPGEYEPKNVPPLPVDYTRTEPKKDNFFGGLVLGFVILAVAIGLIIGSIFVWHVGEGMFKSTNSQNVNLEPQIDVNVTSNTLNEFTNNFNNEFQNNLTLIVNNLNIYTNSS